MITSTQILVKLLAPVMAFASSWVFGPSSAPSAELQPTQGNLVRTPRGAEFGVERPAALDAPAAHAPAKLVRIDLQRFSQALDAKEEGLVDLRWTQSGALQEIAALHMASQKLRQINRPADKNTVVEIVRPPRERLMTQNELSDSTG